MANFAIIENNVVINIVVAETYADVPLNSNQTTADTTGSGAMIGWRYDEFKFIDPTPEVTE